MIKVSKACVGNEELEEISDALNYGYFGLAYKVTELENEIQKFLNTDRDIVCVANGTAALHLALDALGIGPGDEVIIPAFTFVATAQAVSMVGATPVLCDMNDDDFLIDVKDAEKKITPRTKAIIPVHYTGSVCNMDALLSLKEKYGIRIIEDAAHAFGSTYKGKKIGTFGDITCFSFDSIKVMTCGEGGAVIMNDPVMADLIKQKRLLGIDRKTMNTKNWKERSWIYNVKTSGYRYHMSNINAAIGLAQIKKVSGFIQRRHEIAHLYDKLLKPCKELEFYNIDWDNIAAFMYPILVKNGKRDALRDFLKNLDIETGVSYIPLYKFDLYKDNQNLYQNTERVFSEIVCLPMHPNLSDDDVRQVANSVIKFLS